jgi:hypothetical protein
MPFTIPVFSTGFKPDFPSRPSGSSSLDFEPQDLLRAAIVAGHPHSNSVDPLIRKWRLSTIRLAVQHIENGGLLHPSAWGQLDPTEKGQIRNLLGNAITKLLCERLLQAPLMVFLDVYGSLAGFHYQGKRPDFIAQRMDGAWLTIEAKGRDRRASLTKLGEIKADQGQATPIVSPSAIAAHVVSWVYSDQGIVKGLMHDPPPHRLKLRLESSLLVQTYYKPFLALLDSAGMARKVTEPIDFKISLHPDLAKILERREYPLAIGFLREFARELDSQQQSERGYAPDGIRVELGGTW